MADKILFSCRGLWDALTTKHNKAAVCGWSVSQSRSTSISHGRCSHHSFGDQSQPYTMNYVRLYIIAEMIISTSRLFTHKTIRVSNGS